MLYLQEVGQLVHFEDPLENLSQFYFTDLKIVFSKISTLVGQRSTIMTGTLEHSQVITMLCDDHLPLDLLHTFLRLLERMGVAFPITNHSIIVPALLPANRSNQTPESSLHHTKLWASQMRTGSQETALPYQLQNFKVAQRLYSLHIMPANFLCQLVARIVSSFDPWRSSLWRVANGHQIQNRSCTEMPYLDANHDGRYRSRTDRMQMTDIRCWKYGMMAFYEEGYIIVESIDGLRQQTAKLQLCGIHVTVAGDMSVLGFIIDQVETLLLDWFPEFSLTGLGGFQQLERFVLNGAIASDIDVIPSSGTHQAVARSKPLAGSEEAHHFGLFTVEQCCVQWQVQDTIPCPKTGEIQLTDIIPDILMEDIPRKMHITAHELSFNPAKESFIGYGGEADVYVHTFRGKPVAVKVYHLSSGGYRSPSDTIGVESTTVASHLFAMLTNSTESFQRIDVPMGAGHSIPETAVKRSQAAMQLVNTLDDDACSLALVAHGATLLDIFSKMRKEVTFLLQLRHPCIVSLMGVCLRPLCLLTEYAPVGSLSSALSTVRHKELKTRGPNTTLEATEQLFSDGVLGRALTWKIAFQIAHALEYLHHCRVIYHDLKSANVLLFSLDINTPINAKVADYGIAQYLSLSGAREIRSLGTPGFQAPEVTQLHKLDRIFNEQADIFSFAMVLYELLTGHRPFARPPLSALEIPEKISLGERPPLDSHSTIPRFVELMFKSWRQKPQDRPTAQEIVKEMKTESFVVQRWILLSPRLVAIDHICPAIDNSATLTNCLVDNRHEKIKAMLQNSVEEKPAFPIQTDLIKSGIVWAIGGSGDERRLTIANAQTGRYHLREALFPGPRVKCMGSVAGQQMWLGIEQPDGIPELRVYGSPGAEVGFPWEFRWKSHLDKTPLAILSQKNTDPDSQVTEYCVLLSLSDGSMTAFYGKDHCRTDVKEELYSSRSSLEDWRRTRHERNAMRRDKRRRKEETAPAYLPLIKDDNFSWDRESFRAVDVNDHPVTCMIPVGQDEVWCGAHSQICILSWRDRSDKHLSRAEAIQVQGFHATHLVHLNDTVWVTDNKQSCAWLYNVNTRSLTVVLDFGQISSTTSFPCPVPSISNPHRSETVISEPGSSTSASFHRLSSLEQRCDPTQAESKASATALPSIEVESPNACHHLEAVLLQQPVSTPTSPVTVRQEDGNNMDNMDIMMNIGSAAAVGDAVWLGRVGGDIIVVDGNNSVNNQYLALGCLQPQRASRLFGCPVQTLTPLSCGLVVVGRQPRSEGQFSLNLLPSRLYSNYFSANDRPAYRSDETVPLDIWEAWSCKEFNWFRQQQSHLETNV
jgi:serine/threonine protein kinase